MHIIEHPSFRIIGLSARTSNAKELLGQGVIGAMWQRLMSEDLLAKIPNRSDSKTTAMYTDYESDASGEYTFLISAKVNSLDQIPDGMIGKTLPAGQYAIFTSERGPVWEVVPKLWQMIWLTPLERAYVADFEVYDERAANPADALVEIWVGVK